MTIIGVILGLILGVLFSIGLTTYNIAKSNVVGDTSRHIEDFVGASKIEFFVKNDQRIRK